MGGIRDNLSRTCSLAASKLASRSARSCLSAGHSRQLAEDDEELDAQEEGPGSASMRAYIFAV